MQNLTTEEIIRLAGLLRYVLFGGAAPAALPQSEGEWQALFDLSRRQAVTALLYDAILKLPKEQRPPRRILFHFASVAQTVENDNRRREKALCKFAALCAENGELPPTVVKGSALARLWPEPLHRECGDNDLYTGSGTERIARLAESRGIAVDRKDPRHISFVFHGVTFECHNFLLYHNDDIVWDTMPLFLENNANVPSGATHPAPKGDVCFEKMLALQAEQAAFFLAKHCEHHAVFFHNPVRMRTLVDWALLLGSDGFGNAAFCALKSGTDVDLFAELLTLYCNALFGLALPCDGVRLAAKGLKASDFERLYMRCPERHRLAAVRFARRSWKYLRYWRQYRALYGQSMFRRFYLRNVRTALRQHI